VLWSIDDLRFAREESSQGGMRHSKSGDEVTPTLPDFSESEKQQKIAALAYEVLAG